MLLKDGAFIPNGAKPFAFPTTQHTISLVSPALRPLRVWTALNSQTVLSIKYLKEHSTYLGISKEIVEFSLKPLNIFWLMLVWHSEIFRPSLLWFICIVRSHILEGGAACDVGLAANCTASHQRTTAVLGGLPKVSFYRFTAVKS